MREAITRIRGGLKAALDALTLIEVAYDEAKPARIKGVKLALTDLADGFRGLAALATTAVGGHEADDDRQIRRMAEAAARVVFERRGNHAEAHVSEAELVGILEATILLALELR